MTDGVALLMAMTYSLKAKGLWRDERQANLLDGGAPFYGVYRCADGKWLAVGALEPQFFDALIAGLGLDAPRFRRPLESRAPGRRCGRGSKRPSRGGRATNGRRSSQGRTPASRRSLDLDEAPRHPHNVARETFLVRDGAPQPAPAPRFSRTQPEITRRPAAPGEQGEAILRERGFSLERIDALKRSGAL